MVSHKASRLALGVVFAQLVLLTCALVLGGLVRIPWVAEVSLGLAGVCAVAAGWRPGSSLEPGQRLVLPAAWGLSLLAPGSFVLAPPKFITLDVYTGYQGQRDTHAHRY